MASTAKYQPAPQRDSFDEPQTFTQAPPSYQTAGPSGGNDQGYGTPRSEDDNLPDDFKVCSVPQNTWMVSKIGTDEISQTVRRLRGRSDP